MSAAAWIWVAKLVGGAALLALAVAGVRGCQEHYRGQGRDEVQTQWSAERREQARLAEAAHAQREREQREKEHTMARAAEENARVQTEREEAVARGAAGVQRSADGLRSTIAGRDAASRARRAAGTCPAASTEADEAATARALLGACTGEYRELAHDAAALATQVMGLQDHVLVLQPEAAALVQEASR